MHPAFFPRILASLKVGILVFDREERLRLSNAWFDRHAGWGSSPVDAPFAELFPGLVGGRTQAALRQALDHRTSTLLSYKLNRTPFPLVHFGGPQAGMLMEQLTEIMPLSDEADERWSLVAVHDQSTTARNERVLRGQAEELRKYSFIDGLTEIPNRRRLDQYLGDEMLRARRQSGWLALVMFDVDHFKRYNDAMGHLDGDSCLRRIAKIASGELSRASDLVARYGGEEFAAVLPDTELEGAASTAERIRQAVEAAKLPHPGSSVGPYVTVSIGVAAIRPTVEPDRLTLLATADRALYQAKRDGRNRTVALAPETPAMLSAGGPLLT